MWGCALPGIRCAGVGSRGPLLRLSWEATSGGPANHILCRPSGRRLRRSDVGFIVAILILCGYLSAERRRLNPPAQRPVRPSVPAAPPPRPKPNLPPVPFRLQLARLFLLTWACPSCGWPNRVGTWWCLSCRQENAAERPRHRRTPGARHYRMGHLPPREVTPAAPPSESTSTVAPAPDPPY